MLDYVEQQDLVEAAVLGIVRGKGLQVPEAKFELLVGESEKRPHLLAVMFLPLVDGDPQALCPAEDGLVRKISVAATAVEGADRPVGGAAQEHPDDPGLVTADPVGAGEHDVFEPEPDPGARRRVFGIGAEHEGILLVATASAVKPFQCDPSDGKDSRIRTPGQDQSRNRGGCSVRKCFGVRESRPYSGRRSPKSCRFFLLFAWQKLFFHDFSPTAPTLRGFVA